MNNLEDRKLNPELVIKQLKTLELKDIWKEQFSLHKINRADDYYNYCFDGNLNGTHVTLLAFLGDHLTGCAHLKYYSYYSYFRDHLIPEINDFNVFPEYQKQGIGNKLMEEFEQIAIKTGTQIGIGVGLFKDYGAAQRIYCRRGYIPDGNGIMYNYQEVAAGSMVRVDDDLNLYFIKDLKKN